MNFNIVANDSQSSSVRKKSEIDERWQSDFSDQSLGVLKYKKKWEFHSDVHEHLEVVEHIFHVAAGFLVQRLTDEEGELQ